MTDKRRRRSPKGSPRALFSRPSTFVFSAGRIDELPVQERPEVCFAGRSNVGKSSLINALLRRKSLVHTSSKPGKTRRLNYLALGDALWLVDMPGYGYANRSRRETDAWLRLIGAYIEGRRNLACAYVLIDARRGVGELDHTFMDLLDSAGVTQQWVLTKSDKVAPGAKSDFREALDRHPTLAAPPLRTSAYKGTGLDALRADIARCIAS